jgi:hypothetical protein
MDESLLPRRWRLAAQPRLESHPAIAAFLGIAILFALRRRLEVGHHYLAGVRVFL